ncbi:MAG: M2 family metallopeptidase [Kofleriaceae bacterium]|nr:MAG: M2 family metallopeptidase [Kofleriaceae bacterium]MBZ0237890.1 M2 family metallopeptidase [Kofleriaceae bacterium]
MKRVYVSAVLVLAAAGCKKDKGKEPPPTKADDAAVTAAPTPEEATAFMAEIDKGLRAAWTRRDLADWERSTNITPETEAAAAKASEEAMAYLTRSIKEAQKFTPVLGQLDEATRRQFHLLRLAGQTTPDDPAKASELSKVITEMDSTYGKGEVCDAQKQCKDLGKLSDILAESRKPEELLAAWQGWHDTVGRAVRPYYERFVPLANEGVRAAGWKDVSELWLSRYDMPGDAMVAEADRLWTQVEPLYKDLHCYVRRRMSARYGADVVPPTGPMPAHMLGNMWAQAWGNVYPLVEPFPGQPSPDVSKAMVAQTYDATRMTKLAESFFTSLGLEPLPATFWERSMLVQPEGKKVVCHASAWDPTWSGDVRIKMCTKVNQEDLITLHHELGHDYYFLYYHQLPMLFQDGANDGFHEAIGDAVALSVTPAYLNKVGLLKKVADNEKAVVDQQMYTALEKIAFLPWGLLVDKWRWEAFSGKITPAQWNDRWWELRRQYQGIVSPVPRAATDFDPGAKYHVPANTPYLRYFLAAILQFQMHRALCQTAGWKGPLHACSIHGSQEAGAKLAALLAMGSSKPWADALEALTGQREMDATAILDYFAPLHAYLKEQNAGQTCGW